MSDDDSPAPPREYATDEIAIEWRADLCAHSGVCASALPHVFDPARRPWVDVRAAPADEIVATVTRCPSGALRTRRLDRPAAGEIEAGVGVRVTAGGPLVVLGAVRVVDAQGTPIRETDRVALCRCGGSRTKPFCDGTHTTLGFDG